MDPCKIHFGEIRYNPEISGFQARATLHENGVIYTYPVHACASLTVEYDQLMTRLVEKARKMHASRNTQLHMQRRPDPLARMPQPWAA